MAFFERDVAGVRDHFVIRGLPLGGDPGPGDGEGHRAMCMRPCPQRRAVIGRHQDAPVAMGRQCRQQRADAVLIDFLQGLDLGIRPALMRGFVGRFDVDTTRSLSSMLQWRSIPGRILGVEIAGARNIDSLPPQ